ncbi:MAG: DUF418 domain-containing protein [Gemmatimonadales bacterium]
MTSPVPWCNVVAIVSPPREPAISAPSSSAHAVAPSLDSLEREQRLHALDILRGLAILGMIVVHWHQMIGVEATGWRDLMAWGVWVLVEQKSWGIFAFLFGAGFAVFLRRLEARGDPVVPIYLRRLAALAFFGVVAEVVFGFNVLFEYAYWGLVLLAVRRWPSGALLALAFVAACAGPLATLWTGTPPWAIDPSLVKAEAAAVQGSDYWPLLAVRWVLFLDQIPDTWPELLPNVNLMLFVLGLLAVRHHVIDEPRRHLRVIVGMMGFGALAWAGWWLVLRHLGSEPRSAALASGLGLIREQWLCFTYIGAVVLLLAYRPWWTERLALFGEAGRVALTNYLLQVAVVDLLASGYGLGLRLTPPAYLVGGVLLFTVQALASRVWLRRYRMGPLEWIWRVVTYWRPQPLRRSALDRAAPRLGRIRRPPAMR